MLQKLFFELIQVTIGQRSCMSQALTMEEWKGLYGLLKKHALLGVGYVAIQKLPKEQWPPNAMIMQWAGVAQKIRLLNLELNEECRKVVTQLEHDGIGAVVIKGQSNLENYPEELREYRNPGDIDLWTKQTNDCGIPIAVQQGDSVEYEYYKGVRGIIEYARLQRRVREDKSRFKPLYYHVEYHTDKGTEVEMHYRPSFLCSPIRNIRMQRWFKEQFDVCLQNRCRLGFPVLTSSVNVVYQLVHLHRHVFEGGVGLRQLMDYYFALRVWHNDVMECKDLQSQGMWSEGLGTPVMSKEEVMAVIRSFGMGKFAGAVMWVLNEVFALPKNKMIAPMDEQRGRLLLEEVLRGGNFGQHDESHHHLQGAVGHNILRLQRDFRLLRYYPEEALAEPFFRLWHFVWRRRHA